MPAARDPPRPLSRMAARTAEARGRQLQRLVGRRIPVRAPRPHVDRFVAGCASRGRCSKRRTMMLFA
jgi:hypothetical protein